MHFAHRYKYARDRGGGLWCWDGGEPRKTRPLRGERIDRATIKKMNHRGQQWPHDFKAEMQGIDLPDRLRLMREAIEREVDHAQLEADRRRGAEEREAIKNSLQVLEDG